jgi:hypothetical protein
MGADHADEVGPDRVRGGPRARLRHPRGARPGPEETVLAARAAADQLLGIAHRERGRQEIDRRGDRRVVGEPAQILGILGPQRRDRQARGLDPGQVGEAVAGGANGKHRCDVGSRPGRERHGHTPAFHPAKTLTTCRTERGSVTDMPDGNGCLT